MNKTALLFAFALALALLLSLAAFAQNNQNNFNGGSSSGSIISGLTSPFLPKSNGAGNNVVNSNFSDDGTNGAYGGSGYFGVGANLPTAMCAGVSSAMCFSGSSTPLNPVSGQAGFRYDSTSGLMRILTGNGSEGISPEFTGGGTAGQVPILNSDGTYTPADPLISVTPITIVQNQSITNTFTTASVPLSLLTTAGALSYSINGVTGSPSLCTFQMLVDDGFGNTANNGSIISLTMSNGRHDFNFSSPSILGSAKAALTYACSFYPTGGTVTIAEAPYMNVVIQQPSSTQLNFNLQNVGASGGQSVAATPANGYVPGINAVKTGTGTVMYPPGCASTVIKNNFSTSGSTLIVAAPGIGASTHICGFYVNSAATTAVTVKLVAGTHGTVDCDTGTYDVSPAVTLQALANNSPVGSNVFVSGNVDWNTSTITGGGAPGTNQQICINLSAAQPVNFMVSHGEF